MAAGEVTVAGALGYQICERVGGSDCVPDHPEPTRPLDRWTDRILDAKTLDDVFGA